MISRLTGIRGGRCESAKKHIAVQIVYNRASRSVKTVMIEYIQYVNEHGTRAAYSLPLGYDCILLITDSLFQCPNPGSPGRLGQSTPISQ